MADVKGEMMQIAALVLGLFMLAIIVGVTYVGAGLLNSTLCTQDTSTNTYTSGVCYNSSGSAITVASITGVNTVLTALTTVLGLVGLVVIILIFAIVVKVARGFGKGFS